MPIKNFSRKTLAIAKFALILMVMTDLTSVGHAKPCPVSRPAAQPIIIGFTGWTPPIASHRGSSVGQIIERLRERGFNAEVYLPNDWPAVAKELAARGNTDSPIILLGYSMGAAAAIHVAQTLGAVGVPVSKLVIVEAWNPEPVPRNVGEATHYYATRFADRIRPAPGNDGPTENIDLNGIVAGIEDASHVSMSRMTAVHDLVIDRIGGAAVRDPAIDKTAGKTSRAGTASVTAPKRCSDAASAPAAAQPGR